MAAEHEIEIARLGHQGDGLAAGVAPEVVPFALPGERWRIGAGGGGTLAGPPSPARIAPACRHFGVCGGCSAQHLAPALYADWKGGIVAEAFRQQGLEPDIAPLIPIPPATRRRAVLAAERAGGRLRLGYHGRASHDLVALDECPVLVPEIVAALPGLGALASAVLARGAVRMTVLATPAGLDVALAGGAKPTAAMRSAIAALAAAHRFARVVMDTDLAIERARPALLLGGVAVVPPPGAFVQATRPAEQALTALVVQALAKARRIADLFAGVGTFTFPLAATARVLAADSDAAALAALASAARGAQGLKPIETRTRDLFREPFSALELKGFDGAVLDPPRAGAHEQARALAKSKIATIAYVSCNPATLARDARVLVDAGFALGQVTPIDQFLWSAHVEAVAVFTR